MDDRRYSGARLSPFEEHTITEQRAMKRFLIFSYRKRMWYGPDCAGYTRSVEHAGKYSPAECGVIVTSALPGQLVPVDLHLAETFQLEEIEAKMLEWRDY